MTASGPAPDDGGRPDVVVEGLRVSYDGAEVLHGVDLTVAGGSIAVLLGPSGCGKTTLLRTIAGLQRADAGTIRVGERLLTGPGVHVPPERRRIGMVFQDWALFPHMTVARNVAYGLGRPDRDRVRDALAMVGLTEVADRLPGTLSGGQQQRVALARALAPRPSVLLMDEPFSNLDAALRSQVRTEVHRLLRELGVTTVFVTHDQEEAFALGDTVAVMSAGRIVQHAPPAELYARPVAEWVAGFVGDANLVEGEAHGTTARTPFGPVTLAEARHGRVRVLLRPEHLRVVGVDAADGVPGVGGVVELSEYYGHDTVLVVRPGGEVGGDGTVRVRVPGAPPVRPGDRVTVSVSPVTTVAWPAVPAGAR